MSTVSKKIADDIIVGSYPEDHAVKIVEYTTPEGAKAYGVIFKGNDPDKYRASPFVINPVVYWEAK